MAFTFQNIESMAADLLSKLVLIEESKPDEPFKKIYESCGAVWAYGSLHAKETAGPENPVDFSKCGIRIIEQMQGSTAIHIGKCSVHKRHGKR